MSYRNDNKKNMIGWETDLSSVIGLKVVDVEIPGAESATLKFSDGRTVRFWLEGDCCSNSYFTDPESQFGELRGAVIQEIEDRDGASRADLEEPESEDEEGSTSWHFLVFTTDKGHVTIDWRNDSNGYYDGTVEAELDWA